MIGICISPFALRRFSPAANPLPAPPYAVFSADGSMVLDSLSGFLYYQGIGPSIESDEFGLYALGLSPAADDITITPANTNFEVFNPDTSTWVTSTFNIAYTGAANTTLGFKIRLKAGLSPNGYAGGLTVTAPNTTPFILTLSGSVLNKTVTNDWIDLVELNGGSVTDAEESGMNVFLDTGENTFDWLCIHGTQNAIAARAPVYSPSGLLIALFSSLAHTPGGGYTGNGTSSYYDSNFNPFTDCVQATNIDFCYFFYLNTNQNDVVNRIEFGCSDGTTFNITYVRFANQSFSFCNNTAGDVLICANTDSTGFYSIVNTGGVQSLWRNGVVIGTRNSTPSTMPNAKFYGLSSNTSGVASQFSNRQISMAGVCKGSMDQVVLNDRAQALGAAFGWV